MKFSVPNKDALLNEEEIRARERKEKLEAAKKTAPKKEAPKSTESRRTTKFKRKPVK